MAVSYVSKCEATKKLGLPKQARVEAPFWNETLRAQYYSWVYLDEEFAVIELPVESNLTRRW